jgi:3-methyladenine DNA glycosylase/8-oxoguanine DNA glycosylase
MMKIGLPIGRARCWGFRRRTANLLVASSTRWRLKEIGIGEWTAQYHAMRAFYWPDAFPATDLGIRKALGIDSERGILERAEAWRPWRGYAAMHLWRSLA